MPGGLQAADELRGALGEPFARYRSILDFGCGSARVLPHVVGQASGARGIGADIDPRAIDWARSHYPQLSFAVSGYEPPLPFPAAEFDLVYSISVLSHLNERSQEEWLAELARVLAPAGAGLLSVHGAHAFEQFRSGRVRTAWCPPGAFARGPLRPDEIVFVPYLRTRWNRSELPGVGAGYGLAFHGADYVASNWSRWLTVERIEPRAVTGWQDVVVCRSRPSR